MIDEKIVKFFEGVLSKTKAGKIQWEPTAQETTFLAAIGGEFTLAVSAWCDPLPGSTPRHGACRRKSSTVCFGPTRPDGQGTGKSDRS